MRFDEKGRQPNQTTIPWMKDETKEPVNMKPTCDTEIRRLSQHVELVKRSGLFVFRALISVKCFVAGE